MVEASTVGSGNDPRFDDIIQNVRDLIDDFDGVTTPHNGLSLIIDKELGPSDKGPSSKTTVTNDLTTFPTSSATDSYSSESFPVTEHNQSRTTLILTSPSTTNVSETKDVIQSVRDIITTLTSQRPDRQPETTQASLPDRTQSDLSPILKPSTERGLVEKTEISTEKEEAQATLEISTPRQLDATSQKSVTQLSDQELSTS